MDKVITNIIEPDITEPQLELSLSEASALYRILINEWIPLDDTEAHEAARKIIKFVDGNKKGS